MFVSLNRKFLYTVMLFFLIISGLFLITFYLIYSQQIQNDNMSSFNMYQQYLGLLNENIQMKRSSMSEEKAQILDSEKVRIEKLLQNYDARYSAFSEGVKVVAVSTILISLFVLFLWFLIKIWVVKPINRLSNVSNIVSKGNLSSRVVIEKDVLFKDELDNLTGTFNKMLDNLEKLITDIRENKNFLQSLIDSIPDGIRVIDKNYNVILANKSYYKQIKASPHADLSKCYADSQCLKEPCNDRIVKCPIEEICTKKQPKCYAIQQFKAFPNKHLAISAALLVYNSQRKYIVESIRDLSNEITFSHQQKLSSLWFIATSVAHEMKNNLGAMRMVLENLYDKHFADKPELDESRQLLDMIQKQLNESILVPERLLKLSAFSGSNKQKIDCVSNIEEVISLLDYEAKKNGIAVQVKTGEVVPQIEGFEADFRMIFINLLLNAFKAMADGGSLIVDCSGTNEQKAIITVSDSGKGIDKKYLHRIFEPFFSEDNSSIKKGTGLGLAIVKSIVDTFGGTITVNSKKNVGTTFTLKFKQIK